ncbi:MerR family transcriptional regulator [Pedobacter sandarakinus]|uniref:MerR family transcriptional regulator n=1 Tax=Pedobacter sandarakinus TaxID=353156 RepID=UPI002247854F|nr:MerR family transcriptional regulator [Pedobacter sandarakinus]MCX2574393.1 MerR family transcriptional regulator [Pedobacter sandarakinus]
MSYSISDLERLSGIQSHTIRIWEQRYNALDPTRSVGNTRLYNDHQLKKLLNIASLNKSGLKISKICNLSDDAVDKLLNAQYAVNNVPEADDFYILQLVNAGITFDEPIFHSIINSCFEQLGVHQTYRRIIYPLLVRIGLLWRTDHVCPSHEHFLSNLISQKISAAIELIPPIKDNKNPKWLLFLPEDETHDIGLLFAKYMLLHKQQNVIFLGARVPIDAIESVLSTIKIDNILVFMSALQLPDKAQQYLSALTKLCTSQRMHLAGNANLIGKLDNIDHINWIKNVDDFERQITKPTAI